jgi:hypothetical protein
MPKYRLKWQISRLIDHHDYYFTPAESGEVIVEAENKDHATRIAWAHNDVPKPSWRSTVELEVIGPIAESETP